MANRMKKYLQELILKMFERKWVFFENLSKICHFDDVIAEQVTSSKNCCVSMFLIWWASIVVSFIIIITASQKLCWGGGGAESAPPQKKKKKKKTENYQKSPGRLGLRGLIFAKINFREFREFCTNSRKYVFAKYLKVKNSRKFVFAKYLYSQNISLIRIRENLYPK